MTDWTKSNGVFVANCDCGAPIKSKAYYLTKHSGKCGSCAHKKAPYAHVFNRLKNTARFENHAMELTFEEFLNFTKETKCHYCAAEIPWAPFRYSDGKYKKGGGYFLDRKDNLKGYSVDNCVVCCTRCNISKSDRFSYEEWKEMTACLKLKR